VPTPALEGSGYLIEVLAAGVNPVDWLQIKFRFRIMLKLALAWFSATAG
jgi:NADPH:quinone reductase-like Zn-dependent oxidoreductase